MLLLAAPLFVSGITQIDVVQVIPIDFDGESVGDEATESINVDFLTMSHPDTIRFSIDALTIMEYNVTSSVFSKSLVLPGPVTHLNGLSIGWKLGNVLHSLGVLPWVNKEGKLDTFQISCNDVLGRDRDRNLTSSCQKLPSNVVAYSVTAYENSQQFIKPSDYTFPESFGSSTMNAIPVYLADNGFSAAKLIPNVGVNVWVEEEWCNFFYLTIYNDLFVYLDTNHFAYTNQQGTAILLNTFACKDFTLDVTQPLTYAVPIDANKECNTLLGSVTSQGFMRIGDRSTLYELKHDHFVIHEHVSDVIALKGDGIKTSELKVIYAPYLNKRSDPITIEEKSPVCPFGGFDSGYGMLGYCGAQPDYPMWADGVVQIEKRSGLVYFLNEDLHEFNRHIENTSQQFYQYGTWLYRVEGVSILRYNLNSFEQPFVLITGWDKAPAVRFITMGSTPNTVFVVTEKNVYRIVNQTAIPVLKECPEQVVASTVSPHSAISRKSADSSSDRVSDWVWGIVSVGMFTVVVPLSTLVQ